MILTVVVEAEVWEKLLSLLLNWSLDILMFSGQKDDALKRLVK